MGTEAGPIRAYGRYSRQLKKEMRAHVGGVYCMAANAEQGRVYSGSNDFTIYEWDVAAHGALRMLAGHANGVRCLLCIGTHLWSGSDDHTVKVWDVVSCACVETLTGHSDSITSLAVAGAHVWSSSADKTIRVWHVAPTPGGRRGEGQKEEDGRGTTVTARGDGSGGDGGAARRSCVNVIRAHEGGQRVGNLVSMGGALWAPTGSCISVFDPKSLVCDGALAPRHKAFITQICRVSQRETRILWSYSLADKSAKIFLKETSGDVDQQQFVDELKYACQKSPAKRMMIVKRDSGGYS